ncbi:protein DEHYDRATION-INDUCED 19 homolog 4-like isoform X2 [Sorghum bicolor]|uniref:protein DEHYDRATION-INDUCED 19 homolog 4-like isoform X2 n=1 Tax=Sorghum bicolor TaxID=4558 RepID=UPI000B424AA0|nr:protein DEHYDRATION-INDUCED 19 homolog 4-like isoform X2 [Sorghum bicolor]|eukprot:XP_021315529.1 protein DEHYDRATION-INDUCED 19 homolog 4-like isoform X2 [Sorghum bicolor]
MDSDLWISRLMAAKRQFALQRAQRQHAAPASHHDRFGYDDIEPEDDVRSDFPCPYCYEDHDVTSLCAHLEDEHPFESKIVRHHRVRRVTGNGNHNLSYAGRDLQLQETYLKVLLGNSSRSSSTNASSTVTDSLLSSLVLNLSSLEVEDTSKSSAPSVVENNWFKRSLPSKTWKLRNLKLDLRGASRPPGFELRRRTFSHRPRKPPNPGPAHTLGDITREITCLGLTWSSGRPGPISLLLLWTRGQRGDFFTQVSQNPLNQGFEPGTWGCRRNVPNHWAWHPLAYT